MTRSSLADTAADQSGRCHAAESLAARRTALPIVAAALAVVVIMTVQSAEAAADEPGVRVQYDFGSSPFALDLTGLADGVRDTRAISFLAKLEVKEKAERLFDDMQQFHEGRSRHELTSLRERFDALLEWLVSLVSPGDPALHDQLVASRDVLWHTLADPATFRRQALPQQGQNRGR